MVTLDQIRYAEKVIKHFGQENCKEVSVPLPTGCNLRPNQDQLDISLQSCYQLVIRSLLYIMLETRPDIAFAVIKMSQYSSNPMEEHLQKVLYVMHYLLSTKNLCIQYSSNSNQNGPCAYLNTDLAGDIETSCSTTGYAVFLGNSIVSWPPR